MMRKRNMRRIRQKNQTIKYFRIKTELTHESCCFREKYSSGPFSDHCYVKHISRSYMCNKPRTTLPRTVLSSAVKPLRYKSHFTPCLKTFSFTGDQTVTFDMESAVETLVLHAKDLLIESPVRYVADSGEEYVSVEIAMNSEDNTVSMRFPSVIPKGFGTLSMRFHGTLNDQMAGFYRSGYLDMSGKQQYMGVTQLEAIDARRMFPCVDEPAAKAEFELSITTESTLTVLSNMPEAKKTFLLDSEGALLQRVDFMPSPRMSTYLVAVCLGQFEFVQATTNRGTLVRVLAPPGKAQDCSFALDVGVRCLEYYEEFFDQIYPLPKLDMVAVPDFAAGAMENWGLVTYREIDLLCDLATVSVDRKMRLATVVTHELAHQWFGNLVTMEWWDDLWLNEGFASFMQTLSADFLFPEWKIWDQYISEDLDVARSLDGLRSSHPVQVPIPKAEDVEEVFDAISYCKGSCLVRQLFHVLGPDTFKEGIRLYIQRHKWGNTVTDDLWSAFQAALDRATLVVRSGVSTPETITQFEVVSSTGWTVKELMDTWTLQMGYPLISVTRTSSELIFTQSWFVSDGSQLVGDEVPTWIVPLFLFDGISTALYIMREKQMKLPFDGKWIKVNAGEIVPLRVEYIDAVLRGTLLANISSLTVCDRIGLLSDTRALARAGKLRLEQVFSLLASFEGETNVDVWSGIEDTVNSIERICETLGLANQLAVLVVNVLVGPILKHFEWDHSTSDSDSIKRLRSSLLRLLSSFVYISPETAEYADIARVEALKRVDEVSDDIRCSVYKLALAGAAPKESRALWESLKAQAVSHTVGQGVRLDIYSALGYVNDAISKEATLDWILTNEVKIQDFFYPISGVRTSSPAGAELAYAWLNRNFEQCKKRVAKANPTLLASVVSCAAAGSTCNGRATEIENTYGKIPSMKRNMAQLVESIRSNALFVKREFDLIG